jgi:hypothetical protein
MRKARLRTQFDYTGELRVLVYEIKEPCVQRTMDLVRQLLLRLEQDPVLDGKHSVHFDPADLGMADRSKEEIGYHLDLLLEAGYIKGKSGFFDDIPIISKLTWEGHEFLDNIKDAGVWAKTKKRVEGLSGIALKVVAAIAEAEIRKHLGL